MTSVLAPSLTPALALALWLSPYPSLSLFVLSGSFSQPLGLFGLQSGCAITGTPEARIPSRDGVFQAEAPRGFRVCGMNR